MALNDVYQCRVVCNLGNQFSINLVHYRISSIVGTQLSDGQMAAALDTAVSPLYVPCLCQSARYYGLGLQKIFPVPRVIEAHRTQHIAFGTSGATPLPPQVASVTSLSTQLTGRKGRGRFYGAFPSTADSDVTAQSTGAYRANLIALTSYLFSPIALTIGAATTTLTPVIWHRKSATMDDVSGQVQRVPWGTVRKRSFIGRGDMAPF